MTRNGQVSPKSARAVASLAVRSLFPHPRETPFYSATLAWFYSAVDTCRLIGMLQPECSSKMRVGARKSGGRTLIMIDSLKKYIESLPQVSPSGRKVDQGGP